MGVIQGRRLTQNEPPDPAQSRCDLESCWRFGSSLGATGTKGEINDGAVSERDEDRNPSGRYRVPITEADVDAEGRLRSGFGCCPSQLAWKNNFQGWRARRVAQ